MACLSNSTRCIDPGVVTPGSKQTILHLATVSKESDEEFEGIVDKISKECVQVCVCMLIHSVENF